MRGDTEEQFEESAAISSESEEDVDLEESQTDEEQKKIREELTNKPTVSKQRRQ